VWVLRRLVLQDSKLSLFKNKQSRHNLHSRFEISKLDSNSV
jgi:hypothetical protein